MAISDKWMICTLCDSRGSYVNPAIDSHGLTAEDFAEDPGFAEDYKSGVFDVPCRECGGFDKVLKADHERLMQERQEAAEERRTRMAEDGCWEPGVNDPRWG